MVRGNTLRTAITRVVGPTPRRLVGRLTAADPRDFWRFNLRVRSSFNLSMTGIARNANANVFLLNNRGGVLRRSVRPRNLAERINNVTLDPGTYFVRAQRRSGTTRYILRLSATPISPTTPDPGTPTPGPGVTPTPGPGVTPTPGPGVTPTPGPGVTPTPVPADFGGNSFDVASPLVPDRVPALDFNIRSFSDFVGDVDPNDYFSFSPTTTGDLSLQLTGLSADANIELYDGNRTLLTSGGATDNLLQRIDQSGGTYFIRVLQASTGNNTNYTLSVALTPIDTVGDTPATSTFINDLVPTTPPTIRQPTTVRSEFVGGSDIDLYRFDLPAAQTGEAQYFVGIDLSNQGGNADLELYSGDSTTLGQLLLSSNRGVNAPEQIGGTLGAGTYYIRVAPGTAGVGSPYSFTMYAESTQGLPTITRDIAFGEANSTPSELTNVGGVLYFAATEIGGGAGLWRSTGGTLDQTTRIRNFSTLTNFVAAGSNLYFVADDGQSGLELWKYDGATAIQLTNNPGNSSIGNLTAVGSNVYFTLSTQDTVGQPRVWRSDGTVAGTAKVGNPDLSATDTGISPGNLVAVGDDLYYAATEEVGPQGRGREVWKIDGAGTANPGTAAIVANVNTEPGSGSIPRFLTAIGDNLFFVATDGDFGTELRRLDSAGNLITFDVDGAFTDSINLIQSPETFRIVEFGGNVYFAANDQNGEGEELWRVPVNGAANSFERVTDINPVDGSTPRNLTVVGNRLFFTADDGTNGSELYVYNGMAGVSPTLLTPNRPDTAPEIGNLIASGGQLYFTMGSGTGTDATGTELWTSDGTSIELVADIFPDGTSTPDPNDPSQSIFNPNSSEPRELTDVNGRLFFAADNGLNGVELWTLT